MLVDNYPVDIDECSLIGLIGGCEPTCSKYLKGECIEPELMLPMLKTLDEIMLHSELYLENELESE